MTKNREQCYDEIFDDLQYAGDGFVGSAFHCPKIHAFQIKVTPFLQTTLSTFQILKMQSRLCFAYKYLFLSLVRFNIEMKHIKMFEKLLLLNC